MPDFNIVPEIGGVDTSNPGRSYSCYEQLKVVRSIFGEERIGLPNIDGYLYVGKRSQGNKYSSASGKIFVADDDVDRIMLSEIGDSGFLFTATGATINAGRIAFRNSLGINIVTKKHKSKELKERQDRLTGFLIDRAFFNTPSPLAVEEEAYVDPDLSKEVELFLDDLWTRETNIAGEQYRGGPFIGPYGNFIAEVFGRLSAFRAVEV